MASDEESNVSDAESGKSSTATVLSARRIKDVEGGLSFVTSEIDLSKECKKDTINTFNTTFEEFLQTKAELSLDELNRCLVLLGTCPNISQFEPENVEISTLFINVHKLLSTIESRSSLLWSALSFVEQAAQNGSARVALVQKFKYMEILGKLLDTLSNPDRILRVLKLLECLTYGITITWQEPYLKDLIKALVNFITGENEILIAPALSTLINLCYKNLPPVYLLLRCIQPEEFLTKIEPYGILACKMSLLLENNLDGVMENDILAFVKFTFSEIHRALRTFNLGLLRHTVEFFADMKANRAICMHFESYDNYPEDVQCILQYIIAVDNSPDYDVDVVKEAKRGWSQCISLLFEFLINVVNLKADVLKTLFPKMASCALKWIISTKAGPQSLELLTSLVNKDGIY
ncbi:unnamed protein product [Hermetia illucens]|uniref:Uncharacterized protein n=1 Tax=Hermetia illucens TaxID=343691 RepID=A0A7R8UKN3_HERIL|nr:unnamed protein product [Hermetia illucens]